MLETKVTTSNGEVQTPDMALTPKLRTYVNIVVTQRDFLFNIR